ncbi:hypothetical protein [Saccharopolyspora cebuensis]|uniref:hypothetical protein n=1 Tax=Saccharopolyspora cebuensis TaxID=418759 RepID=UPI0031E80CB1
MSALPNDNRSGAARPDPDPVAGSRTAEEETVRPVRHLSAVEELALDDEEVLLLGEATGTERGAGGVGRAGRWLAALRPQAGILSDPQPSVTEELRRARCGEHLASQGWLRRAATGYGYAAAGNAVVAVTWRWVVDHPARLAVVSVLLGLAVLWAPSRQVLIWLLWPLAAAHEALVALD